jgi:hypothetical protein
MNQNKMKQIIQRMISIIECICCVPITIYWIYLESNKNRFYRHDTIDQPPIRELNSISLEKQIQMDEYI